MQKTSQYEWVIGLYAYQDQPPEGAMFERFFSIVVTLLEEVGLAVTHIAAEGGSYSGKLVKTNNAAGKRLIESRFAGITVLSLSVVPAGSEDPAYDRIFSASLSWNYPNEVLLCLVANEGVISFMGEQFNVALTESLSLGRWDYGLSFCDTVARQPDFHVLSLDTGRLSRVESQSLSKWYASRPSERQQKLRSVYPLNILSERHLVLKIGNKTLREYVVSSRDTSVQQVGRHTIWRVPKERLEQFRSELAAHNALIA